ncbi:MAG: PorT family protein [Saprospiraceae bacterium]|jgi:hypothetical protein|nr:PorT family protein [Saprospiraceae bacterium]
MPFKPFRWYLLFTVCLASTVLFAQKTNVGFYAGPSISTLRMEQVAASDLAIDPFDFKPGFTVGAFGAFTFADNVAVRGELNFERKGGKSGLQLSNGNGNPIDGSINENFDYLQVPLLFQLSAGKDFKMFIHAGYAFGYLVKRTDKFPGQITVIVQDPNGGPNTSYRLLMPADYKQFDHSLVAGIGASPVLPNGLRLQFSLRAINGKPNLAKGDTAFDARNLSVALLFGVEF